MGDDDDAFLADGERAFLTALNVLGVRFMIVGMSSALLQGARGVTEDIDLWFENVGDARIGEAARRAGGFWVTRLEPPMLGGIGERFDVVLTMSGLDRFDAEYPRAEQTTVDGVALKLLPLERILHSKRSAARTKDEPGIHQIEIALKVLEALEDDGDD